VPDLLIYADGNNAEMRHEVPVFDPDPFLYLERDGRRIAIVPSFEVPRLEPFGISGMPVEGFGLDDLVAEGVPAAELELELVLRACAALEVREAVVPATFPLELADRLRERGVSLRPDKDVFASRRRVKNASELEGIRRAQRATERAMAAVAERLRAAEIREDELWLEEELLTCERLRDAAERTIAEHGATADQLIVAAGDQGVTGHEPGVGPIAPGESIIADLFPRDRASCCHADMTRTFVVGEPPQELVDYHRLCLEALERSLAAIRPGVTGAELHALACEVFHREGYETQLSKAPGETLRDGFFHSLGHGVGLDVHERPSLGRNGEPLVAGDVIAIEPGLYRHGFGGVRLEDLVLVTDDGAELLTDFPYDLAP
jgi:Xaa-Pro aminopeptidase